MEVLIEPLHTFHNRKNFDCGVDVLNDFFRKYARQNQLKSISKTFVATHDKERPFPEKEILGFYTLCSGHIEYESLPNNLKHPRYPVSIARLARLAIDKKHQGKGIGGFLLYDALQKISVASQMIGIFAIVVDAKDAKAKSFYERYGFMPLEKSELTLFLPIETINQLF